MNLIQGKLDRLNRLRTWWYFTVYGFTLPSVAQTTQCWLVGWLVN